ncbi:hypothetical protein TNCV_1774281 [Trichonephila clavipes]|nr:hypothetical protein TNCV_1774281 [Trichonephila clavipes]
MNTLHRDQRQLQVHPINNRRGSSVQLKKRAGEEQEYSLTSPERPGQQEPALQRPGVQNVVVDALSRNPVDNVDGSQILCAALRALALNSREQLIREQREDPELGYIYRYLENPNDGSVNATVCEGWSQDFKLIDGLLFYAKYSTTLRELRVYIPQSLRERIMQGFHDLTLAGHLGRGRPIKITRHMLFSVYEEIYS